MIHADDIENEYFEWMTDVVCGNRFHIDISFRKLLLQLHHTKFRYSILNDVNRAKDGINLRYRFAYERCVDEDLIPKGKCSVLEMMIALAIRCEESIMDDPRFGDRTKQWFWGMIASLGLTDMTDDHFDKKHVKEVIDIFLNREYEPNGKGGLFTVYNRDDDLRTVEIWYQLCWFLDNIT